MVFTSVNPYDFAEIGTYPALANIELDDKVRRAQGAFQSWKKTDFSQRSELLKKVAVLLKERCAEFGRLISLEMGKPLAQGVAEVEKCAWVCDYYAENGERFLKEEVVATDASFSSIRYDPLGCILGIMPWNFPFWQVFRFVAPTVMAGNTVLLKHAPNVFGAALAIEKIMMQAGFPDGVFQSLVIDVGQVPRAIKNRSVRAVSLTGSERAGSHVAAQAAKAVKKALLELGGSNAFIVMEDADLELAVRLGITARMQNNGQSCIAAKRFLVHEAIMDEYLARFEEAMGAFTMGDPLDPSTTLGPLAREDLAINLERQVRQSIEDGAELRLGGKRDRTFFEPTVLTNVQKGMPAFEEELFGPVAAFSTFGTTEEAVKLSNSSPYGLGVSIFTRDPDHVKDVLSDIEDGAVFINDMVKSDPRLPFGGTKQSGFGRELGLMGIREFVNLKTIYQA